LTTLCFSFHTTFATENNDSIAGFNLICLKFQQLMGHLIFNQQSLKMNHFKEKNKQLNTLLAQGKFMEAFELFYAEQVSMQENEEPPRVGKDYNREQCGGFVAAFPDLKLTVLSVAYGDGISFQEVLFEYTNADNEPIKYPEVAVRTWENALIVKEKFYYAQ
jgi:hypothetical protein